MGLVIQGVLIGIIATIGMDIWAAKADVPAISEKEVFYAQVPLQPRPPAPRGRSNR